MRNFKNYVVLSVAVIIVMLFIMSNGVQASSPSLIFGTNTTPSTLNTAGDSGTTTAGTTNIVPTNTTPSTGENSTGLTTNITPSKDNATVNITNTTTNTVGKNGNLPQTGENDIYIVSAIGVIALVVGGIAYTKSRKYDI